MPPTVRGMQFRDRTLLRLVDTAERAAILTADVGDRLLRAAYRFDHAAVGTVTGVAVRDASLLPTSWFPQRVEAQVLAPTSGTRWEAAAELRLADPTVGADAQLDVTLTTTVRGVTTEVTSVRTRSLAGVGAESDVDARIVTEDGALPAGEAALATRRFTALRDIVRDELSTAAEVDLDATLEQSGVTTYADLRHVLDAPNHPMLLALTLVSDATGPDRATNVRVVAAVTVVAEPFADLAGLLTELQVARARIASGADPLPPPAGMTPRTPVPFLVLFPITALDDADLPVAAGSNPTPAQRRAARLTELGTRLQPLGVALAPVT